MTNRNNNNKKIALTKIKKKITTNGLYPKLRLLDISTLKYFVFLLWSMIHVQHIKCMSNKVNLTVLLNLYYSELNHGYLDNSTVNVIWL